MKTVTAPEVSEELVPLTRAAAELRLGYLTARNLALKGQLHLRFVGTRLFVTAASVAALRAER